MNNKIRAIHMIGIGGSGMSGIAEVLLNLGYSVHGSDISNSATVERLRRLGAVIHTGHAAENLDDPQVVVRSSAVPDDNPEVSAARERGIPVIPRAEMLAELMRLRTGIAVAGTHGKTTTTSLTAAIFGSAGLDPTVIIGGLLNAYRANGHLGQGEYLIAESDESDGSFLCLFPIINVVTNVDYDHVDHYGTQEAIDEAFATFMNKVPFYGMNVICGDDPGVQRLIPRIKRPFITYGFGADCRIRGEMLECGVFSRFNVWLRSHGGTEEKILENVFLPQPGRHNILNALAAIGVSLQAGIPAQQCAAGLAGFKGVSRRFEPKGEKNGITVIDDYGHHPTEIQATIRTARQVFPGRRLVMVFQPHRFSRTQALFGEFCQTFEQVDKLFLTEIYPACEKPIPGINGINLAMGIRQVSKTEVTYKPGFDEIVDALAAELRPGDLLITQGAGSVTTVGPRVLEKLA
ncbi:UDP-N-acetylmuramate--L-alanine ligase [uncultured Mailhella sp.]|uniref:UDP-N-acetylmuramate--L-alanine ligase n=1 Tax=uncultured Mailhella sp. TaxID=1981031 RepID=UPI0026347697|nr:UDP-N-acetylmuramate--L-alanine ligase [uncultured Mailhella sp.]